MKDKCYVIPVQKMCNMNCEFCISKSRNYDKETEFLEISDKFIQNLILLKKEGVKTFEITGGGEPLLNPNIEAIIKVIRGVIPDSYIKIYTNGNVLKNLNGVHEINISVTHYDEKVNSKFMGNSSIDLITKLKYFKANHPGVKIRLSIPIIKGAIDSSYELDKMIEFTKEYVDSYVIRTLYPGCPNYRKLFADFDYDRENVIFERDNNVSGFDGLILWSDGNFYRNWELSLKKYYGYLLIKPDARTYINEIEEEINNFGFSVVNRFLLDDFVSSASRLYYDKKGEYREQVIRHLLFTASLFGNNALIYILDKDVSVSELLNSILELKKSIREKYSFTHKVHGYLSVNGEISHLNLVHSPDANARLFSTDLKIIESMNKREVNEKTLKLIKDYRSFNV